jgi:hypothetical protein
MTNDPATDDPGDPAAARMLPTDRLRYSAIDDRPKLALPGGPRMVVWVIVNVEEWYATQPMPRTVLTPPAGGSPSPDIPNWAWHEYGNRVGFRRLLRIFDAFRVPAARHRGSRARPQLGVHGPRLHPVQHAEGGGRGSRHQPHARGDPGRYDWVLDDQPVWLRTRSPPILNVPYTQECNDVAMMLTQHHKASEHRDRAIDQFEQLHADAADSARVMALVLHPYIMGAPHRTRYFREVLAHISARADVLFWTGAQICDWFQAAGSSKQASPYE